MKTVFIFIIVALSILVLLYILFNNFAPQLGVKGLKNVPQRILNSPHYKNGKFVNSVETQVGFNNGQFWPLMREMVKGGGNRTPQNSIKNIPLSGINYTRLPVDETAFTWLGHSSFILQTQGKLFMVDPVFSKRASVVSFMGPKKFPYDFEYNLADVPELDAILLTHDHFDHMDYQAIKQLHSRTKHFYVPLGVKAHLVFWGIDSAKITELDWWDEVQVEDSLIFAAVPTRHFSGRRFNNRFSTLWCGYVVKTGAKTLFFGGDSGMHPGYQDIAEKYGPFDVSFLECGAYSIYWPDIHSFPAQTATAFETLGGKVLVPVHWAKFNLALHGWTEPIEALTKIADERQIPISTPRIGEHVMLGEIYPIEKWWREN